MYHEFYFLDSVHRSHHKETLVFGGFMKSQSVSALQFFSADMTLEAGVVGDVCSLDMSGDVCLTHARLPTD